MNLFQPNLLPNFRILAFLLWLPSVVLAQPQKNQVKANNGEVKSYFLLKLNLDTDPVDLQNYLTNHRFKKQFEIFSTAYSGRISKLSSTQSQLFKWAITAALEGNLDQSLGSFKQLATSSTIRQDVFLSIEIYRLMATITELKGDFEQSSNLAQTALNTAINANLVNQTAELYFQLARTKSLQQNYQEAEEMLIQKALPLCSRLKNGEALANCYREMADMYSRRELFSQAKWFYLQSLSTARKAKYSPGIIGALLELGQFKYETGEPEPATKDWLEAENTAIMSHDLPALLKLKFNLALAYQSAKNPVAAEKYAMEYEQLKDILLNPTL